MIPGGKMQLICPQCGYQSTSGRFGRDGWCKARVSCHQRQAENARLEDRATGSIRYSGDTFDRVERLKRMRRV